MSEFMAQTSGARLACELRGKGRRLVVFVHGLSANRKCFQFLEDALHDHMTLTTLTYDLRGRGHSEKPEGPYGPAVHAADLAGLLENRRFGKFKGLPVVVAHSLGAYAALEFAARTRPGGLVLLDGGGSLNRREAIRIYALLRLSFIRLGKRFPSENEYLELVRKSPLVRQWSPQLETLLRYDMVTDSRGTGLDLPVSVIEKELQAAGGSLSVLKSLKGLARSGFTLPALEEVRCPVLIVRAARRNLFPGDSVLPRRAMAALKSKLPQAQCIEIEANHYSMLLENQPEMNKAVISFLENLRARSSRK